MKLARKAFWSLAGVVMFAGTVSAGLPDSGWYWNPAESGRGFNIEIQNDSLFMAGFVYDSNGKPIWFVSGGPMSSDHTFSGPAFQTANGQPLGGAYQSPGTVPFGNASITWNTTTTATVSVNGYNFNITRETFGVDFTSAAQPMLGEFAMVSGSATLPVYFGERISFNGTQLSNNVLYAVGNRSGESGGNNVAVATYSQSLGLWTVLLDSSTSYWDYYTFRFSGVNLVEGTSSVYPKGSLPTSSLNMVGNRIRSAQAVAGENAPGVDKKSPRVADQQERNALDRLAAQESHTFEPQALAVLHSMEEILQEDRK